MAVVRRPGSPGASGLGAVAPSLVQRKISLGSSRRWGVPVVSHSGFHLHEVAARW